MQIALDVVQERGALYTYDRHWGFITNSTNELLMPIYVCRFRSKDLEQNYTFILEIQRTYPREYSDGKKTSRGSFVSHDTTKWRQGF